jgi:hypothetical protein
MGVLRCYSGQFSSIGLGKACLGHTTFRLSLLEAAETAKCRWCGRAELRAELRNVLAALRRAHGASLEDIVAVLKM